MGKKGKLILVTGYSGSGKSTYVKSALGKIKNLEYFVSYTTREPRPDELTSDSYEYKFISKNEYIRLRKKSKNWEQGEYYGNLYGADADLYIKKLQDGINIICNFVPDLNTILKQQYVFKVNPVVIWLDLPLVMVSKRLLGLGDKKRIRRIIGQIRQRKEAKRIKKMADYVYKPTSTLEENCANFIKLVKKIVSA